MFIFFHGFSLALSIESSSSVFSFFLSFLCLMNLGETVNLLCSWRGVLCENIPMQVEGMGMIWTPVKSFFSACWQLVRGVADGGARAWTGCQAEIPPFSVPITTPSVVGLLPHCWSRSLKDQAWAGSLLFMCFSFCSHHVLQKRGLVKQMRLTCLLRQMLFLFRHLWFFSDTSHQGLCLGCGPPKSRAALWHGVGWAEVFALLRLRHTTWKSWEFQLLLEVWAAGEPLSIHSGCHHPTWTW